MSFVEIVSKINAINESILDDLCCEYIYEDNEEFNNHLEVTKSWFERISFVNKKLYLLALLEDVRSAWTLSLLLKSIWNCRPKDSIFSISRRKVLSIYDQAPFDHNRTALPVSILTQVMTEDRKWFVSLEPEAQALVLLELVSVAGGPVVWQVYARAQKIYDRYREYEIDNLKESMVVAETAHHGKTSHHADLAHHMKKDPLRRKNGDSLSAVKDVTTAEGSSGKAQKKLDECMLVWNGTMKLIRDSFKLEEIETTFNDGTKKRIWKVDRPMPEAMETVDFLQLLPSAIGKRILCFLPLSQLVECSKVNKYWSYLIDELKAEIVARQKIQVELEKLREIMLRHNESEDTLDQSGFQIDHFSSQPPSLVPTTSVKTRCGLPSIRASQKSGHFSFRHLKEKMNKPRKYVAPKPIKNMADLYERLERRGAADENIWKWCKNVSKQYKQSKSKEDVDERDEMPMGLKHFPCPMLNETISVPLRKPLVKDPAAIKIPIKSTTFKIKLTEDVIVTKDQDTKRFTLWSKDFSSLYPASKIATYQSPI
ncbi:uncharacterized protein LOC106717478 [Papilio machaon]|uniref:uncharacterized protein LOC106717478 n=1 Tax=Papilio machaon TaxID=76193 RepID=UPI001E6630F2|nr:uncharacterized protein LOC106717478 [Papilio machaon]